MERCSQIVNVTTIAGARTAAKADSAGFQSSKQPLTKWTSTIIRRATRRCGRSTLMLKSAMAGTLLPSVALQTSHRVRTNVTMAMRSRWTASTASACARFALDAAARVLDVLCNSCTKPAQAARPASASSVEIVCVPDGRIAIS
jgi:hypothetical protein